MTLIAEQQTQSACECRLTFFTKLFRAHEVGQRKAEKALLDKLSERFSAPPLRHLDRAARWFAAHCAPEDVMGWLMAEVRPFAQMLQEIYVGLAEASATISGNVDEVSFDFARLADQVVFSLEAFPKTYIAAWQDVSVLTDGFRPTARGRVRNDTPNYWRDDWPAWTTLSREPVLRPWVFDELPQVNQRVVYQRVADALTTMETHWTAVNIPDDLRDHRQLADYRRPLVADQGDWDEVLRLARVPGSDQIGPAREALTTQIRGLMDAGRLVDAAPFYGLVEHARTLDLEPRAVDQPAKPVTGPDPEKDDTYAFLASYDLVFPQTPTTQQVYDEIVDRVLLPFWRHRWRLVEVWSIVWLIHVLPESHRPAMILQPRADRANAYAWNLKGGDASRPVAEIELPSRTLEVYFQLKSALTLADALTFRQRNIEPDIRLRERRESGEIDLVILELKDRFLAGGSGEKRVARMYATTRAPMVCVANYSPFRAAALRGQIYREHHGSTAIYLVDTFQPGSTPEPIADALRRVVLPWL